MIEGYHHGSTAESCPSSSFTDYIKDLQFRIDQLSKQEKGTLNYLAIQPREARNIVRVVNQDARVLKSLESRGFIQIIHMSEPTLFTTQVEDTVRLLCVPGEFLPETPCLNDYYYLCLNTSLDDAIVQLKYGGTALDD